MKKTNFRKRLFLAGLTLAALLMFGNFCQTLGETKWFYNWKAEFRDWQEEIVCILGEKMTNMLTPVSVYLSEDQADTIFEWMLTYIMQTIPVQGYLSERIGMNQEGKNPFESLEQKESFFLEIEKTDLENLEQNMEKETELESQIEQTEAIEILESSDIGKESESIKESESEEETETEFLAEEVNETEWDVLLRQEGNIFYYQPSLSEFLKEEETQEVFLDRLLQSSAYSLEKLKDFDFLMQKFFTVRETTSIRSGELSVEELLSHDARMKGGNESPQILIYHSHSQEEFCDYIAGETGRQILDVGTYLSELLSKKYGYYVVHDMTPYDVKDGVMDKNAAYTYAGEGIEAILEIYPSIEVIIDLHRDGVNEGVHLVTEVDGKPTAKLMFVNGISRTTLQGEIGYLYNPYIKQNISFSFHLQLAASQQYADFIRRTMISAYRYNLHYREKSLLIEVGAQTNTTQEAMNAMEPLAKLLNEVLG